MRRRFRVGGFAAETLTRANCVRATSPGNRERWGEVLVFTSPFGRGRAKERSAGEGFLRRSRPTANRRFLLRFVRRHCVAADGNEQFVQGRVERNSLRFAQRHQEFDLPPACYR